MPNSQFILLPREALIAPDDTQAASLLRSLPRAVSTQPSLRATLPTAAGRTMSILDTTHENGPKLVEMDRETAAQVNAPGSLLRAVPIVNYGLPDPRIRPSAAAAPAAFVTFKVECVETGTGAPLSNANVVAFDNFATRSGAQGNTDALGRVTLSLGAAMIDRLYAYTTSQHWGAFRSGLRVSPGINLRIEIEPVSLRYTDAVRFYYGNSRFDPATGVTVGVIDTGAGPHHDLNVVSGRNTVTGEPAAAWQDWFEHGTHVSGLIGASGTPPNGLRGMAPGVPIRAYRVFGQNAQGATNYAILKAMIFAATDGCDIINLSLGGGPNEPIVEEAISDARDQGMLVMVAAGNDGRQPVNYPAAYAGSTAVSALGREGTYPVGSVASAEALRPPNSTVDAAEFIAEFSNIGSRVALTAPGVGVLSTLPNNAYGPMSGTSMAAPVAAGAAACLLSRDPAVFGLARDRARSDAIEKLLQSHGTKRGFGLVFEGYGLPDPNQV